MKRLFFIVILLSLLMAANANPVDVKQAQEVGCKFLNANQKMNVRTVETLRLVQTYYCETGEAAFYVFNTGTGFVIVSADDCVTPILGYSNEGQFDPENVPIQLQDYLESFRERIEYGITHRLVADNSTKAKWKQVQATGRLKACRNDREVMPLLREKWNQDCYYNKFCPEDTLGTCGHVYTGCTATAMAQIMHYWRYPERGQGSYSYTPYNHPEYGAQSVDFSAATYDWENMPNSLNVNSSETEVDAVATLMYHCGVSVSMNYGPDGSGADPYVFRWSLPSYFKYSDELYYKQKEDDDTTWLAEVKGCLDQLRPILYSGSGHAYVCDGYDQDDLLHVNFGWGGYHDGYYALDDMGGYYLGNRAVFNIHPIFDPNRTFQIDITQNLSEAGAVEGGGVYHHGDCCVLTAHASEGCRFLAWMENNRVLSMDSVYTFLALDDHEIMACFEGSWSAQVKVNCLQDSINPVQSVAISWGDDSLRERNTNSSWPLLAILDSQFAVFSEGVATDGRCIYSTGRYVTDSMFYKYDISGRLIEAFNVKGCGRIYDLTYDGRYFYGSYQDNSLYCVDLDNKTLVGVIPTAIAPSQCSYDPDYDGFWVKTRNGRLKLIDREGQLLKEGPYLNEITGLAYYRNRSGAPHLFLSYWHSVVGGQGSVNGVYDYDINADVIGDEFLCDFSNIPDAYGVRGCSVGEYMGKAAFWGKTYYNTVIYELPLDVAEVRYYKVYRMNGTPDDHQALLDRELLANRHYGASYIDHAWDTLPSGYYSYGVSLLRGNEESEISWSEPIEHKRRYAISASAAIEEGGTVSGQGEYEEGALCTLEATPNSNYGFVEWLRNDSVVSTESIYCFTVTGDADYVAVFERNVFEIQAFPRPLSAGVVIGAGYYHKGDTVTLTATPNDNYHLSQWVENNETLSEEPTYCFVATEDCTIYADFQYNYAVNEQEEETFSIHPNPTRDRVVVECIQPVCRCEIYSVTGVLMSLKDHINETIFGIDMSGFPSGSYVLRLYTNDGVWKEGVVLVY